MVDNQSEEIELVRRLRTYGPTTCHNFLTALLIWLFGVLVFIPMADSLNWQAGLLCSLIIFVTFTIFMYRATLGFKNLIDVFSFFSAKRFLLKREIGKEDASTLFRNTFYILFGLIVYALYSPFLTSFHFAISGIILVLLLVWIFFLALRIISIFFLIV